MSSGLAVALVLAVASLTYVLVPLFRRDAALAERVVAATSVTRDLQSRRQMLMASLKDVEDDYATGKLDDTDYRDLKGRLTAETVEVLKRLDELKQQGG